jgi:intracellular sulfur oxidation DsrE/DsrF family protein
MLEEVPMSVRPVRALAGAALILGLVATAVPSLVARDAAETVASTHDAWLTKLDGKHRMLFDAAASGGGIPLVHVMNYYDTYNTAYNVPDKDIDGVLTFYGMTTFHGLSDAMWAKYQLGEFLGEKDAAGKAFTANPWRTNPTIVGMSLPQASIESLQKRGATFIICNNALTIFSGLVAQARGLDAKAVYEDMKANILPGVTLVPAMVIAIDKAHQAGLSYHRQ